MLKQVLGILLLHIPIAFPSVFSPTLYLHMFFLFLFPHLLTMSFPPCLQHSSSSFYYSPGPPLPDPSPPTQNMIQSSHYQEKKKKQQDQGGCFSPVEQIKKIKCYSHSLIQTKIKIRQMASPFVRPFYTSGFGLVSK